MCVYVCMFKQTEDGKGHYPLIRCVSNHLNASGHNYTSWHQQEPCCELKSLLPQLDDSTALFRDF